MREWEEIQSVLWTVTMPEAFERVILAPHSGKGVQTPGRGTTDMKDPLNTEQTAYEILGLQPGATEDEIHAAFKNGVTQRKNVQKLTSARNLLKRPDERALLDLFYYDPVALKKLDPNPIMDPSVLDPANRLQTVGCWETQLRDSFPDLGMVHSLAVFWYWWAIYEEERLSEMLKSTGSVTEWKDFSSKHEALRAIQQSKNVACDPAAGESCKIVECTWRNDCLPRTPAAEEMWHRVIATWGMLMSNLRQWDRVKAVSGLSGNDLKDSIEKKIRNNLFSCTERYRGNGTTRLSSLFQNLDLALSMELKTASEVDSIGIRTGKGKISCGRLMLEQTGLIGLVTSTVEAQLRKSPGNSKLTKLLDVLSPFYRIAMLIDSNRPGDALSAINDLSVEAARDARACRLKVRALMERGKQQVSLGRTDEGLRDWRDGLKVAQEGRFQDLVSTITEYIVSTCKEKSAALKQNQRDEAIRILEKGIASVRNEELNLLLAELLTQRGIETINEAQKNLASSAEGEMKGLLADFTKGLKDLERAAQLGFQRAAEQLKIAQGILAQAKEAAKVAVLPRDVADALKEANDAASKNNWDTAIYWLRKAAEKIGGSPSEELNKMLAHCLAMRGVKARNEAIEIHNKIAPRQQEKAVKRLFARRFLISKIGAIIGCELCCKPFGYWDRHYTANKPNGRTARLCERCAKTLERTVKGASFPGKKVVFLMEYAYCDMKEAVELDPKNTDLQNLLNDTKKSFDALELFIPTIRPLSPSKVKYINPFRRNIFHSTIIMLIYMTWLFLFVKYGIPSIDNYLVTKGIIGKIIKWIGVCFGCFVLIDTPFLIAEIWSNMAIKRWHCKGRIARWSELIACLGLLILLAQSVNSIQIMKPGGPSAINLTSILRNLTVLTGSKGHSPDEKVASPSPVVLPTPTKVIPPVSQPAGKAPNQQNKGRGEQPASAPAPSSSSMAAGSGPQQSNSMAEHVLPTEITVKKGDGLDRIAQVWYPDDVKRGIQAIRAANPQLGKKGNIRPGQVLILPKLDPKPQEAGAGN